MENHQLLMAETLQEALSYAEKLAGGVECYLGELSRNCYGESAQLLLQIVEGLEWEFKAISLMVENLAGDYAFHRWKGLLEDLSNAMLVNDAVKVIDLCEYELLPMLETWQENLRQEIKHRNGDFSGLVTDAFKM